MDNSWENLEPSPIEFFHGLLMDKFHEFRLKRTENIDVTINGMELNSIIADCKRETYNKYAVLKLDNAVPKSVFAGSEVLSSGFGLEDLKNGVCIKDKYEENGKSVIIVGCGPEYVKTAQLTQAIESEGMRGIVIVNAEEIKRPKPEDLTLEMIHRPIIDPSTFKTNMTNHERQPASFGKGKNKRRK